MNVKSPVRDPRRLSDAQLLDLVMQQPPSAVAAPSSRSRRASVQRLLKQCGSLRRLANRSAREPRNTHGVDEESAHRLDALFVLARRLAEERLEPGEAFLSPRQIFDHFHPRLRDRKKEIFCVVLLDARHRVMGEERISEGSLTSSIVHPREVFVPAVRESAGAVVFVHNHPSGEPSPSEDDIAVTRRLERAAELLGIRVLDHVIIGDGVYASFKEMGLI